MFRWLYRVASVTGMLLLYRWMLRMGTPGNDWWYVVEYWQRGRRIVTKGAGMARIWLLSQLGITQGMWRRLQARYQSGAFGEAGT